MMIVRVYANTYLHVNKKFVTQIVWKATWRNTAAVLPPYHLCHGKRIGYNIIRDLKLHDVTQVSLYSEFSKLNFASFVYVS